MHLVTFDQKGAFGPAMTLIYHSHYYNQSGIVELAKLLKENFTKLAHIKPKGKKEFCALVLEKNQMAIPITPIEIISSRFFQNMQKTEPMSPLHNNVLEYIVPGMMNTVRERMNLVNMDKKDAPQINDWIANFLESYMTEEQIKKQCELRVTTSELILEERKNIGTELYKAAIEKHLTEKDLDAIIEICHSALVDLKKADHQILTLKFISKYLNLFSMNDQGPAEFGEEVLDLLSTIFKKKMFPKNN